MRIVYILTSLGMGGAERHTIALAEWMASHGHSVLLVSLLSRQPEEWPTQLEAVTLDLRKSPASVLAGLRALGTDADAHVCRRHRRPAGADAHIGAAGSRRWTRWLADGTVVRALEYPSTAIRPMEQLDAAFTAD